MNKGRQKKPTREELSGNDDNLSSRASRGRSQMKSTNPLLMYEVINIQEIIRLYKQWCRHGQQKKIIQLYGELDQKQKQNTIQLLSIIVEYTKMLSPPEKVSIGQNFFVGVLEKIKQLAPPKKKTFLKSCCACLKRTMGDLLQKIYCRYGFSDWSLNTIALISSTNMRFFRNQPAFNEVELIIYGTLILFASIIPIGFGLVNYFWPKSQKMTKPKQKDIEEEVEMTDLSQ